MHKTGQIINHTGFQDIIDVPGRVNPHDKQHLNEITTCGTVEPLKGIDLCSQ